MRCFIALEIGGEIKEKIFEISRNIDGNAKKVEKENLHATLIFLGEISEEKALEIKKIVNDANSLICNYEIEFKGVGAFPSESRPRVIWVGAHAPEINALHKILCERIPFHDERFHPHVTIARVRDGGKIGRNLFEKYGNEFFGKESAGKIVLKKSTLTPNGPIYEDV